MRLTLTNFGTWTHCVYEFPDASGLTLISGPSGKGKTTLLRAINYALTGEGTKLPTHGEIKCTVCFEYQDLIITRTNRPGRLTVKNVKNGITYEADEAQSLIYNTIGRHFSIAGYIQQKGENSFLCMSPSDKLHFLEKVAFSDIDIESIKERSKDLVNKAENTLSRIQGEVDNILKNKVHEPESFSYKTSDIEKNLKDIKNKISSLEASEKDLNKRIQQSQVNKIKRESLINRISEITETPVPEKKSIDDLRVKLDKILLYEKYMNIQTKLNDIQKRYDVQYETEFNRLNDSLKAVQIVEFSLEDKEELLNLIDALKVYKEQQFVKSQRLKYAYDSSRIDFLSVEVAKLEQTIPLYVLGKEAKHCPSCKSSIRICKDYSLEVYTGAKYSLDTEKQMREQLQSYKKELIQLEFNKRNYDALPKEEDEEEIIELNPEEVEDRIKELKSIEKNCQISKDNLEKLKKEMDTLSSRKIFKDMTIEINALKSSLPAVIPDLPEGDAKKLESLIYEYQAFNKEVDKLIKKEQEQQLKLQQLQKELLSIPQPEDETVLKNQINTTIEQLNENKTRKQDLSTLLDKAKEYERQLNEYLKYKQNLTMSENEYKKAEQTFTCVKKFRDAIITSEFLAINSLIEEINTHLQQHLNLFFPDNPITIEVKLFKENEKKKTVKNQVHVSVGYRGTLTDLNSLSGGEKDRVNLAFTLALAEIFNLPLLMLDETLSSLDRESTENILEHIQKESRNILVVAHQVTSGLFDHIIKI